MANFKVVYNPQVYQDILKQVNFYNLETGGQELGNRFLNTVETALNKLNHSALHYQIRYDDIRLLPLSPFSFRAHYRVDEEKNIVMVEAIIHTSEDPEGWKNRTEI